MRGHLRMPRPACGCQTLVLLLHLVCQGVLANSHTPAFDLGGACAGIRVGEDWKDGTGTHKWSYKISVAEWQVFARIHVTLHGWEMQLREVYYGQVDNAASAGSDFTVVLHPQSGQDNTFEIQGSGEPYTTPSLVCDYGAAQAR